MASLLVWMRWTARVVGTLITAVLVVFAIGEGFGPSTGSSPTPRELAELFLLLTSCVGLLGAWRWEGLGGGIAVGCMLTFVIIVRGFPLYASLAIVVPGILFLLCRFLAPHTHGLAAGAHR